MTEDIAADVEETTITTQTVAEAIMGMHAAVDEIQQDSIRLIDYLEHAAEEAEHDDPELYEEICDLMAFAHTVYLRLEGEGANAE